MVKLQMDLNSNNLSDTVIPACFRLESSDLRRWMPASAGMTKYSGQQCAEAGIQQVIDPYTAKSHWIPAFAGMTSKWDSSESVVLKRFVTR
jgi:hypothetical protein